MGAQGDPGRETMRRKYLEWAKANEATRLVDTSSLKPGVGAALHAVAADTTQGLQEAEI